MATETKDGEFTLMRIPQDLIERGRGIAGRGHDVWLAGLGAFAAVEEEGTSLFNDLVTRGRTVENSGRRRVKEVREQIDERQQKVSQEMEERVYDPLMKALRSFGVPTKGEVRELSAKVDALTRQVQLLLGQMQATASGAGPTAAATEYAVYYVMAREDGWVVGKEGVDDPLHVEPTKDQALERARTLVHNQAPSRLHVYRRDGSIQDTFTYDE